MNKANKFEENGIPCVINIDTTPMESVQFYTVKSKIRGRINKLFLRKALDMIDQFFYIPQHGIFREEFILSQNIEIFLIIAKYFK
jgi:hypothetical protein